MPYQVTVYEVFIASPGDVVSERAIAREVIYEWNAMNAGTREILLQPVGWERLAIGSIKSRNSPDQPPPNKLSSNSLATFVAVSSDFQQTSTWHQHLISV